MPGKPDYIKLRDRDFKTPAHRAAARELVAFWNRVGSPDRTRNFAEIARRTGWSEPHIRNVYNEYFEAAEDRQAATGPDELDVVPTLANGGVTDTDAYRAGYRDGYQDGREDST